MCDTTQNLLTAGQTVCTSSILEPYPFLVEDTMVIDSWSVYRVAHIFAPC